MGLENIKKIPLDIEMGDTGTRRNSGYTYDEFIPELRSINGAEIYDEMRKNDGTISGILTMINQLLYNVTWDFETDGIGNDYENRTILTASMFDDMEKPFTQVLSDVYTFLPFGYSTLETVWKRRLGRNKDKRFHSKNNYNDGLWAPRKLPLRSQKTIVRWAFDPTGTPIALVQNIPIDGREVTIPFERILHFRTTAEADLPEGISILRGSYENYQFIKKIKRIEAVSIERDLAGIPVLYVPASIMSAKALDEEKAQCEELCRQLVNSRNNSQSGWMLPSNVYEGTNVKIYDFNLVKAGGQKQIDTNITIERYQADIAIQLLADFVHMGAKKAGGTYNLAEVKIKLFAQSLNYYLDIVQTVFNDSLIPQIYQMNNWPEDKMCKIKHGNIDTLDFEVLAKSVMELLQTGGLTPDESLERHLRNAGNIPQIGEDKKGLQ